MFDNYGLYIDSCVMPFLNKSINRSVFILETGRVKENQFCKVLLGIIQSPQIVLFEGDIGGSEHCNTAKKITEHCILARKVDETQSLQYIFLV